MKSWLLINRGMFKRGIFLGLICCFASYTSPPWILGLSWLFIKNKKYKELSLYLLSILIYSIYVLTIIYIEPSTNVKIDFKNIEYTSIFKNFLIQVFASIDASVGFSFFYKIYLSICSISLINFFIASISFYLIYDKVKHNFKIFNNINLFISYFIIFFISIVFLSTTNSYFPSPFNLGNRINIMSSLFFVSIILKFVSNKKIFFVIMYIFILSTFGLSAYWKNWNILQLEIIEKVKTNDKLLELQPNDILIVEKNLYSKMSNISHIEFFEMQWNLQAIFNKQKVYPLNEKLKVENEKIFFKDKQITYSKVFIYNSELNIVEKMNINILDTKLNNLKKNIRHPVQLVENKLLINLITFLVPKRLEYLIK